MADLAASIAKARKAGYSDAEIAAYIAKDPAMGPKVQRARKAGYSDAQIISHLSPKRGMVEDFGRSLVGGLKESVAGIADTVGAAGLSPASVVGRMSPSNPFGMPTPMAVLGGNFFGRRAAATSDKPEGTAGNIGRAIGLNAPNAIAPGSLPARAVNVFAPALGGEAAAATAKAMGAGERGQEFARIGGSLAGAGVASLRPPNPFRREAPIETVARRTRQDPAAMQARAAEYRASGIDPTLADVVDDTGRGAIRAAANKPTPARQVANEFAEGRVENLPSRLSAQARSAMSRDPRTPDAIRAAEVARRSANADRAFSAVRGQEIQMAPETVRALRSDYGRNAIAEAAARERDPEVKAALLRLATAALDDPSTPITVGMADRISRVLGGKAQAASRTGDNDLAATLGDLARAVRDPAKAASPGYGQALEGFAADSRLVEAADVGESLMTANTDEFVAQASRLGPRERALAAAAGRRAIERKAGENVSSAAGIARRLATAPEQQQRTAALIGPQRAQQLQDAARLEARAVQNARSIQPSAGSSTFLNLEDNANLSEAAGAAGDLFRGRWGNLVGRAYEAWRTRGMSDQQIEELVRVAIDPNQTDAAIQQIAARLGPQQRQEFLSLRNAAMVGAITAGTGIPQAAP